MRPDILTIGGRYFSFLEPEACEISIEEIAHALAHICRFTGHTRVFYSVAQHSVEVSYLVPPEWAWCGLMHDAAEAVLGDVSAPLKRLLPDYREIERRVEEAMFRRLQMPKRLPDCVKKADLCMLATEQRDLMPATDQQWEWQTIPGVRPRPGLLDPLQPQAARILFEDRVRELNDGVLSL